MYHSPDIVSRSRTHAAHVLAVAALTALTLLLSSCAPADQSQPTALADHTATTTTAVPAADDTALTPREADPNVSEEEARTAFMALASASITAADVSSLTETSHFDGANTLTLVYDPAQPKYKSAYLNTQQPERYVLVLDRDYFTANYALRLANQKATRVQANLDGSYTLFPAGDPYGYTYDKVNERISHVEGVHPETGKNWATSLEYRVTEDGLTILSNAVNDLSE